MTSSTSPRHFAADIMQAPKEQRAAILTSCPAHLRDLVRSHVNATVRLRRARSQHNRRPQNLPRRERTRRWKGANRALANRCLSGLRDTLSQGDA